MIKKDLLDYCDIRHWKDAYNICMEWKESLQDTNDLIYLYILYIIIFIIDLSVPICFLITILNEKLSSWCFINKLKVKQI